MQEVAVAHAPLLAQRRTLLVADEPVELALDALEAAALAVGELLVEALADLLPLLAEVDAVVPDEVHFLFFVLGARGTSAVCPCACCCCCCCCWWCFCCGC